MVIVLLLGAGIFTVGKAVTKDLLVKAEINDFKIEQYLNTRKIPVSKQRFQTRRYYKVPRETSYELNDSRSVFYDESRKYLGQTGDIFMSQDSPFPNRLFIHQFISYYFGGHAAIKNENNQFIER